MEHLAAQMKRPKPAAAKRALAALLAALLLPLPELAAQNSTGAITTSAPLLLHINILEGEDALNNIRERTAREPIIQVEDANHKPVAGVAVVFTSVRGTNGAGGTFNQFTSYKTVTNAEGKAVGRGFQPNNVAGQYSINVQVAASGATATAVITETNVLLGGGGVSSSAGQTAGNAQTTSTTAGTTGATASHIVQLFNLIPKWVVVGVVAGGATAVAVTVTQTQQNSGATVSTGGGTVAAPAASRGTARR